MTEYIIDDVDVIVDFLRAQTTDPQARAEASNTENITATAGQTDITLSPTVGTVSTITSITVNGSVKTKWKEYYWDYQNQKVTFYSALALNDAVAITYKQGTSNWIYGDKPDDKLNEDSYPRIEVYSLSGPSRRLGTYEAEVQYTPTLNISIWTKDRKAYTINSRTYSNNYLGRYLAYRITKAFEDNVSDLHPLLYDFVFTAPRAAPYSENKQAYHTVMELTYSGLDIGKIDV